jgi:hypothetical protein
MSNIFIYSKTSNNMRRIAKIQSVENITKNFGLVPHMDKNLAPDATHIWEDSQVFAITFTINLCTGLTPEGEEIIVNRVYRARVEVMNAGDHYLHSIRDIVTPRDFDTREDITAPLHYVRWSNVQWINKDYRLWKKFSKVLEKEMDKPVYPWA